MNQANIGYSGNRWNRGNNMNNVNNVNNVNYNVKNENKINTTNGNITTFYTSNDTAFIETSELNSKSEYLRKKKKR